MNEVLYVLCKQCVSIMDGWIPCPSTVIAKICGITLYRARKEINKLKEQGFVVSDRYVETGDERPIIVNGYTITEKAKKTMEYKKALDEERAVCMEVFGIDICGSRMKEDGKEDKHEKESC